ncbi:MAG: LD-carboxypeptidase [Candidatus Gastranaerophilales bacterium]|nr:LD-carboxypeptidase [Candidatus Gastranaerophilales bacterium]
MNIIKPKKLQKGDTIGILAVSGLIKEAEKIKKAKKYFEALGYKVVLSKNIDEKFTCMAGTDDVRLKALHNFFADEKIDAILCARGGYGVLRLVKNIDYELIKNNPKLLIGYSDITALLAMIYKNTGLITFHGAMANGDFGADKIDEFTKDSFFSVVTSKEKGLEFKAKDGFKTYSCGVARGILWGGNLSTITTLAGIDFIPDEKFIFFFEDINEPAYKIDRMLTQLFNIEKFKNNLAGIAIGEFVGLDKQEYLDEFLADKAQKLDVPVSDGFYISHAAKKYTLPIGVKSEFDANLGLIKTLESAIV